MQEEEIYCEICEKRAVRTCNACESAYYCTRDHQMEHWNAHSKHCKAYKLVDHPVLGKHYIATRNIKVGDPVMYDKSPILSVPQNSVTFGREKSDTDVGLKMAPFCLSCYNILEGDETIICKCGWHLCHLCKTHGDECEFTLKYAKSKVRIPRTTYGKPHPAYETIGLIRALFLLKTDMKGFLKLLSLRDPLSLDLTSKLVPVRSIRNAARFAKAHYKIDDIALEPLCKIMRIIMSNGVIVPSTRTQHHSLYFNASYIEHNCRANCSRSFTEKEGVIIWAATPIAKGEHISINYVPALWGNIVRRVTLANLKYLDCQCDRCKDPTEFGTMLSSIKCRAENCDGLLVPPTFSVLDEQNPDYVCSKCPERMSWQTYLPIEEAICVDWMFYDNNSLEECTRFLERWNHVFHENHYHTIDTQLDIILIYGFQFGELIPKRSESFLINLVETCKRIIGMYRLLSPAENQFRALALSVLSRANKELNRRRRHLQSRDERIKFWVEHKEMLNELYELLHREPSWRGLDQAIAYVVSEELRQIASVPEVQQLLAACSL